jgi:hypothetical protein
MDRRLLVFALGIAMKILLSRTARGTKDCNGKPDDPAFWRDCNAQNIITREIFPLSRKLTIPQIIVNNTCSFLLEKVMSGLIFTQKTKNGRR